ncbi:hypothetical protein PPERSA_08492 [Pseudocohnilembus persalinus]|uniref:Uncharacterized protein n=1 Tax=Pseudocohnilembus persalinus TaxID=266149 RepID=A0A0V0R6H8_PSEPJ|nr:hypothetical protein PPERSA_08492 [Pseudocohnilembus persalinus]|eukprot:KRX10089.1 hypothetical protein PPERSA_08492 [Pseudocohnilembus persalinus]
MTVLQEKIEFKHFKNSYIIFLNKYFGIQQDEESIYQEARENVQELIIQNQINSDFSNEDQKQQMQNDLILQENDQNQLCQNSEIYQNQNDEEYPIEEQRNYMPNLLNDISEIQNIQNQLNLDDSRDNQSISKKCNTQLVLDKQNDPKRQIQPQLKTVQSKFE